MATQVTVEELRNDLARILARVEQGREQVTIVRDDQPVALLVPAGAHRPLTLSQLADLLKDIPLPGDGFADDLEEIQAESTPQFTGTNHTTR
jgi:prevent-host-death family protein